MRASEGFITTLKETPNDAEIVSHQLMLRAGMIRKLGQGLYTWLPLGLRVLRKVENIVREEMNRIGALEVLMPAVQPAELWHETGRWETFGGQLLTMQDSNGRDYCFGPTHEEVITDLMRNELQSYKQLPVTLYQIQTKFRDEIRPRFGVMRAREFIMKDAYSFHLTEDSLQKSYKAMYDAYGKIFDRLGLTYRAVEADTGAIGGNVSHEFQVLAEAGEDLIFYSDKGTYAANSEQATSLRPTPSSTPTDKLLETVATPNKKTITEVSQFLNCNPSDMVKTMLVVGENDPIVALVLRGDDEVNPIKAAKHPLVKSPLTLADEALIEKNLKLPVGFIGPVELSLPIIVDFKALAMDEFICGANNIDKHFKHAAWNSDAKYTDSYDLRMVQVGDESPDGVGKLLACRGIEVGHVFQLGDKYTKAMQAEVINEESKLERMIMGTYGLGISRVVAASIEQHHDENGIIWPQALAPFQVVIIPINTDRALNVKEQAESLYQNLLAQGIDVLLDDRSLRPGVLFADNDLIGIPHRLVVSERHLANASIEYKARNSNESKLIKLDEFDGFVTEIICGMEKNKS